MPSREVEPKENEAAASEDATFSLQTVTIRTQGYLPMLQQRWEELKATTNSLSPSTAEIQHARGKVRDRFWKVDDNASTVLVLWTTDRQSGFDRDLCVVPYKGAVLNLCSVFWFQQTRDIIGNHFISAPHPSVSLVRKCRPFPIEFVVRSYLTGSTSTSIWKHYEAGERLYCGHVLADGMKKNQPLPALLLTPTTKDEVHDRPISLAEIVQEQFMTQEALDVCAQAALRVFARGQEIAAARGLILVDTKYEFGRCPVTNEILLIDEVHTPDSSRYWIASSYAERFQQGQEPENIDKEFLRLWYRDHCDPYDHTVPLPEAPRDLVLELSRRYLQLYEMITGRRWDFTAAPWDEAHILQSIRDVLQ